MGKMLIPLCICLVICLHDEAGVQGSDMVPPGQNIVSAKQVEEKSELAKLMSEEFSRPDDWIFQELL